MRGGRESGPSPLALQSLHHRGRVGDRRVRRLCVWVWHIHVEVEATRATPPLPSSPIRDGGPSRGRAGSAWAGESDPFTKKSGDCWDSVAMTSSGPTRVLVVTDRTAATPELLDAIRQRAATGPIEARLLVPNPAP